MSEILQKLLEAFLEEEKVFYTYKEEIYAITFKKPLSEIFGEKVKCTFKETKKNEKVQFLGQGSFLLSTIISKHRDQKLLVALSLKPKTPGISAVQDKIDELQEKEKNGHIATYQVKEQKILLHFAAAEIEISAALQKETEFMTLLYHEDISPVINKEELLEMHYERLSKVNINVKKELVDIRQIIEKQLTDKLRKKEEQHEQFIQQEVTLKDAHYQQLMKETGLHIERARERIEEKRTQALKSRSFEKMYSLGTEKKKEEKKLKEREKEADMEKDRIRDELLAEIEQIKNMKFRSYAEIIAIGVIEVETFTISYSNGKNYCYIPELHIFQEKKK
ncbi:hypothetical protein J4410_02985 [Candidatus Woesearchaeota archaeon]|nr:hypothetical protein [Candidatus Woesearchaeota archaeon]